MKESNESAGSEDQTSETPAAVLLDQDTFYRALASQHRRRVLYYLLTAEESNIEELATVLSGWEATETGTMATPSNHEDYHVLLRHQHLPVLTEAGLITHDSQEGTVQIESLHPRIIDIVRWSVEGEPTERG